MSRIRKWLEYRIGYAFEKSHLYGDPRHLELYLYTMMGMWESTFNPAPNCLERVWRSKCIPDIQPFTVCGTYPNKILPMWKEVPIVFVDKARKAVIRGSRKCWKVLLRKFTADAKIRNKKYLLGIFEKLQSCEAESAMWPEDMETRVHTYITFLIHFIEGANGESFCTRLHTSQGPSRTSFIRNNVFFCYPIADQKPDCAIVAKTMRSIFLSLTQSLDEAGCARDHTRPVR